MRTNRRPVCLLPLLLLGMLLTSGCVKLVADYDATMESDIVKTAKMVDEFYRKMLETPAEERQYKKFKDGYFGIETELNSLYLQQKTKPLNKHSIRVAEIARELFAEDKADHKETDTFKTTLIIRHNAQLQRVFVAMANAEAAKKLVGDK